MASLSLCHFLASSPIIMNPKLLIATLLVLLLSVALCQGGGGGRGGGGRSGGSKARRNAQAAQKLKKCQMACETKYKSRPGKLAKCMKACEPPFDWTSILFYAVIIAIAGGVDVYERLKRKRVYTSFAEQHVKNTHDYEISESEEEQLLEKTFSQDWRITFQQKDQSHVSGRLILTRKPKCQMRYLYSFTTKSHDFFGSWTADGYISFSSSGVRMLMVKDYTNKKKAGQTGSWSLLVYQGQLLDSGAFKGHWFYKGFERDPKYSGSYHMEKWEDS